MLTRRSNVSPKHKSCKVRGSSPTPGEAMSAKLAAIHWPGHSIIICATITLTHPSHLAEWWREGFR